MLERFLPYSMFILDGLFSSYSADMWALGACLLELTTGLSPVPCSNLLDLITNLRSYAGLPELPELFRRVEGIAAVDAESGYWVASLFERLWLV